MEYPKDTCGTHRTINEDNITEMYVVCTWKTHSFYLHYTNKSMFEYEKAAEFHGFKRWFGEWIRENEDPTFKDRSIKCEIFTEKPDCERMPF